MAPALVSDSEFVASVRAAIERYFVAIDRWEAAYRRYYRMPGNIVRPSGDLAEEQREVEDRRRELEVLLPRVRALCFKYSQRDVFTGLRYAALGRYTPQERKDESAVGRTERSLVMSCLMELSAACREPQQVQGAAEAPEPPARRSGGFLQRIVDFFY
jgi:hypothetical protein